MKTRSRSGHPDLQDSRSEQDLRDEDVFDLEALGEDDLEALLFDEDDEKPKGLFNLPTMAGLSLILVGMVYILERLGIGFGFSVEALAAMLPWLAGVLIILLGFGVLSWRPRRKKKRVKVKKGTDKRGREKVIVEPKTKVADKGKGKRRLTKSYDKKVAGVCGGIAEYFSIDPTLVRIAFVVATIIGQGSFLIAYLVLAIIMPKPDGSDDDWLKGRFKAKDLSEEERIMIIRDS